jgi:Tfp pilus assembly PilM family ATPase
VKWSVRTCTVLALRQTGGDLLNRKTIRTGIDLGSSSIKLVRGEGARSLDRVTHAAVESLDAPGSGDPIERVAGPLRRLMERMRLRRESLGRVAVAVWGEEASVREVMVPPLTSAEFRSGLPFLARKHLYVDGMSSPVFAGQILGPAPPSDDDGSAQIRVIIAAAPSAVREFPLRVLAAAGIEPEVIDLEPLAGLNALMAEISLKDQIDAPETEGRKSAGRPFSRAELTKREGSDGVEPAEDRMGLALLDMGAGGTYLHMTGRRGGFMTRPVGPGAPSVDDSGQVRAYVDDLFEPIRETLTYYRGKMRKEIDAIFLGGGGALLPDIADRIREGTGIHASVLDPFRGTGIIALAEAPRFVTACGLCRFGDRSNV